MSNSLHKLSCEQCGSSDFSQEERDFVRCSYCNSLYKLIEPEDKKGPKVIIRKGANVTFGKNANVVINGGLLIEEGANVKIHGKLELVQRGTDKEVEQAKVRLKKIKDTE